MSIPLVRITIRSSFSYLTHLSLALQRSARLKQSASGRSTLIEFPLVDTSARRGSTDPYLRGVIIIGHLRESGQNGHPHD
jgi:hypothetical protein